MKHTLQIKMHTEQRLNFRAIYFDIDFTYNQRSYLGSDFGKYCTSIVSMWPGDVELG